MNFCCLEWVLCDGMIGSAVGKLREMRRRLTRGNASSLQRIQSRWIAFNRYIGRSISITGVQLRKRAVRAGKPLLIFDGARLIAVIVLQWRKPARQSS